MKRTFLFIMLILNITFLISQEILLPLELYWWENKLEENIENFNINYFIEIKNDTVPFISSKKSYYNTSRKYFIRRNFSNTLTIDPFFGVETYNEDGKNYLIFDADCILQIYDNNFDCIFQLGGGITRGFHDARWLTDEKVIVVGSKFFDDLVVFQISIINIDIKNKQCLIRLYEYKSEMSISEYHEIQFAWYLNRNDLFLMK